MQLPSVLVERPLLALAGAVTATIMVGNLVVLTYWVYRDASVRGSDAPGWWAVAALSGIGLFAYVLVRERLGDRTRSPTGRERAAEVWTRGVLSAAVASMVALPPDPFTTVAAFPPLFALGCGIAYLWVTRIRSTPSRSVG